MSNLLLNSSVQKSTIPPAFLCSSSNKVMDDPVLALCGHLFEKTVSESISNCPADETPLRNCIPFDELKKSIEEWKASFVGVQAIGKASSSSSPNGVLDSQPLRPNSTTNRSYVSALSSDDFEKDFKEVESSFSKIKLKEKKERKSKEVSPDLVVRNVHQDDIHGFISISPEFFVSGSKDNTLKMWNVNGELVQPLVPQSSTRGYKYWVTALSKFSNGYWASGTRDGYITIWNQDGQEISNIWYNPSKGAKNKYICKDRNKSRINCITELRTNQQTTEFYTGTPRYIQLWDGRTGRFLKGYRASDNDWVYCIEVLENNNLLVVIGSDLEYWNMSSRFPQKQNLIEETKKERRARQRPHISAITRLEHNRDMLSSALFDGSVKIVNIATQKLVHDYQEHIGRVWAVTNLQPQILASSADDKSIKIWDIRQRRSTMTITGNPGRVSSLLRLSETILISGSCPDKVFDSQEKASITFWDIRKII